MDFSIVHETTYSYKEPVQESSTVVILQPRTDTHQVCSRHEIETTPASRIYGYRDRFGNDVQYFTILPEHRTLTVMSRSHVVTFGEGRVAMPEEATRRGLLADPEIEMLYEFTHESSSIVYGRELRNLLQEVGPPSDAVGAWYLMAGQYINEHFAYDKAATTVFSDVDEAIRGRAGVCQDFAHVLVGLCRLANIPARYASGYIYSGSGHAVIGAEASHAWCEAYLPPYGWVGYDPTNVRLVDEHFVKLAFGRDYQDVTPVRGVYKGRSDSAMSVNVAVQTIATIPQ